MQAIDWWEASAHEAMDEGRQPREALHMFARAAALSDVLLDYYCRHRCVSIWLLNRRRTGERLDAANLCPISAEARPSPSNATTPQNVTESGEPGSGGGDDREVDGDGDEVVGATEPPMVERVRRVYWERCMSGLCREVGDVDGAASHALEVCVA